MAITYPSANLCTLTGWHRHRVVDSWKRLIPNSVVNAKILDSSGSRVDRHMARAAWVAHKIN